MNASKSSQCVFCISRQITRARLPTQRLFHSTPTTRKRTGPGPSKTKKAAYIDRSRNANWNEHYTPEQLQAIKAAEELIPKDEFEDGISPRRSDPWAPKYLSDLSELDPVVDKPTRARWENLDDNLQIKSEEELGREIERAAREFTSPDSTQVTDQNADVAFFSKMDKAVRVTTGKETAERNAPSAMAPSIPSPNQIPSQKSVEDTPEETQRGKTRGKKGQGAGDRNEQEVSPALVRLMQMTGLDREAIFKLRVKSVISHRVVNQTRLGKVGRQYVLSIAGNRNGLIGIGEGKSEEGVEAAVQSQYRAIRNMQPIMRYENRTTFGDLQGKVGATELELYARPPGFGLRCQQYIWEICQCAGIHDLAARVTRARNPMNTVKATVQALLSQKDPQDIARARGKKMVDVRKVYYAGQV